MTYAYDADGRVATKGGSLAAENLPAAVSGNTFNAANEMTAFNGTALSGACPERSRRDANGNLTGDGTNTYTWDARNHLSAISGGATASFVYDAFGRPMSKTLSGVTTEFLYDGLNPVQELDGSVPPSPTAELLTGLDIDEYFTRTDTSGAMSLLTDGLGSTLALTDSSGSINTSYTYEPFGNTTVSGPNANPYQFTGRENDGAGLYFYRARYYSPTFQRFVAQDPIGLNGDDVNLYRYVEGNPVNWLDPLGLETIRGVPSDAVTYTTPTGQSFYAPPQANWCTIYAAGKSNGLSPSAANKAIGQFGLFDFQRSGGNFYPAYTNASNYGVGVYMNGAGYSLFDMNSLGSIYSFFKSSNANDPSQLTWWDNGWNAANSGSLVCTCPK